MEDDADAVGLPETVGVREKWKIAPAQVRPIVRAGFTITGVVVDADYGRNAAFRERPERLGVRRGVAIRGDLVFTVVDVDGGPLSAADLTGSGPTDAWQTVTWSADPASPNRPATARYFDEVVQHRRRRQVEEVVLVDVGMQAFAQQPATTAPLNRPDTERAEPGGESSRGIRELKSDLGLDHSEGCTYRGWTHHVVLTTVAFTFLQIERGRRGPDLPRPTLPVARGWVREIVVLLYFDHNRRLLGMLDRFRRNALSVGLILVSGPAPGCAGLWRPRSRWAKPP